MLNMLLDGNFNIALSFTKLVDIYANFDLYLTLPLALKQVSIGSLKHDS